MLYEFKKLEIKTISMKVVCISKLYDKYDYRHITIDKIYSVISISGEFYNIKNDENINIFYHKNCFIDLRISKLKLLK